MNALRRKDLLGIADLTPDEIALVLDTAEAMKEIGSRPAAVMAEDAPILNYLRAVDSHLGILSPLDFASTDANIPMSLGIPAVSIGAGGQGGGAHTLQEWFKPEGRDLGLKRIELIKKLLL